VEEVFAATELRQQVRQFLRDEVPAGSVDAWELTQGTPRALIRKLGDLGLCRFAIPEEYGGAGRQIRSTLVVVEELARQSHSLAGMYWGHVGYVGLNLSESGTAAQKAHYLPRAVAGHLLFAYGLSEPNVGADLASVETTATRNPDGLVVRGAKRWTSMANVADYIYALVRSGEPGDRRRNLSFLIVPTDAPGVTITPISTMGDKGVAICEVLFDDVQVPAENLVGGDDGWNRGWEMLAGPALEVEKLGVPAMSLGIAEAAVAEAWDYSQQRIQFGRPICTNQALRHALADAQTKLQACRLMVYHAGGLVERGQPSAVETSMAKLYVCETAKDIVLACQQVMGAAGYAKGYGMERCVRDALALPIVGGSSAIQRNNIASLLKLPRE
jgi:alkylation response protein AidB-like acyl-CoA dehydrogenase